MDSLGHLLGRAALVEQRIRLLIAERRADDPAPDDPFRGLYLTDEVIDRLLDGDPRPPPDVDAAARPQRDAELDWRGPTGSAAPAGP